MAISVISRPEKTLLNGNLSRWNGSRTPLNYKFESNLYPTNNSDPTSPITDMFYSTSRLGTIVYFNNDRTFLNVVLNDFVTIEGTNTNLDGGIYKIKSLSESVKGANNGVVLDVKLTTSYSSGGTIQKNYKGYKGLARVYVGAPNYHTYYNDGSKPEYLAGVLEVEFDSNNEGIANVRQFVKPDLSSDFDKTSENSHNLWTSFFIEYSETWDNSPLSSNWQRDTLPNCDLFTDFNDPIFENALGVDWFNRGGGSSPDWFHSGDSMDVTLSDSLNFSAELYQNKKVYTGSKYEVDLNIVVTNSNTEYTLFVVDEVGSYIGIEKFKGNQTPLKISVTPSRISDSIGFIVRPSIFNGSGVVTLNDANILLVGSGNQCDYSSFAVFGTKQFQDILGGNFGDYVLDIVDNQVTPKLLTHFESLELFPNNSFVLPDGSNRKYYYEFGNYFNAIIPSSTFYKSEGGDNLFLNFVTFNSNGDLVDESFYQVGNKDDGVYSINFLQGGLVEFDYGYCQFIIIPSNKLVDGDGGTYDDNFPANWNITPIDIGNSVNSTIVNYQGQGIETGEFYVITSDLQIGFDAVAQFESNINTIIGSEYVIESDVYVLDGFDPRQANGGTECYLGVEGMNESELKFTTAKSPTSTQTEYIKTTITTTFKATSTNHRIQLKQKNNIALSGSTGGKWFLKNTTFKGPVDYISEQKPIKLNTDCFGYEGVKLRWLNNLGGWEYWNFKQYQTRNESFKKTEIKKDILADFDDYFINGETQYETIGVETRENVTVRSGLLTVNQLKELSRLQLGIKIQMLMDSGKWQTVSIKNGSFTTIEEDKKMHEISFDIKLVDTLIQEL